MAAVKIAFRSVEELTREELNELKQNYVVETAEGSEPSYGELADSVDIPDAVIFKHYAGISFGPEDFFCNIWQDE